MEEIFVPLTYMGLQDLYEISNFGNVRSLKPIRKRNAKKEIINTPRNLKPTNNGSAFLTKDDGEKFTVKVAKLVALEFIEHNNTKFFTHNIDGDITNNRVDNIRIQYYKGTEKPPRKKRNSKFDKDAMFEGYFNGISVRDLANMHKCSYDYVLHAISIGMNSKKERKENEGEQGNFSYSYSLYGEYLPSKISDLSRTEKSYLKECENAQIEFTSHRNTFLYREVNKQLSPYINVFNQMKDIYEAKTIAEYE
jgi:hypothetical protein